MKAIGKRKFILILIFMFLYTGMVESILIFLPSSLTGEALQTIFTIFGLTVMTGLGAIGIENLAKYGFGKKNKEEVEPYD